jgi:hypothetical protein
MAEAQELQVSLMVSASGQDGRFEVVEIKDHTARIRLLGNKKDTGEPVELNHIIEVPILVLTPLEELRYWYLQCKICGASHREPVPAQLPKGTRRGSMPVRLAERMACPKFPDKFEIYTHEDWCLLTQSKFKASIKQAENPKGQGH